MPLSKTQKIVAYVALGCILLGIVGVAIWLIVKFATKKSTPVCSWVKGPWSACDDSTNQTRLVTCQSADGTTPCSTCDAGKKPAASQSCTVPGPGSCCDFTSGTCTPSLTGACAEGVDRVGACAECVVQPTKWPDNVHIFTDDRTDIQTIVTKIFTEQGGYENNHGQFSKHNYALLFAPGTYTNITVPIGYYTHVAGLGSTPAEVIFAGAGPRVNDSSSVAYVGALNNFWRACENLTVNNPSDPTKNPKNKMKWAVSQAASLRSVVVDGDIMLFDIEDDPQGGDPIGGYASGGFMANVTVTGDINNGSQQQFMLRNTTMKSLSSPVWNQVLIGCAVANPPTPACNTDGTKNILLEPKTPVIWEKPYLVLDDLTTQTLSILVPEKFTGTSGAESKLGTTKILENDYFIARPGMSAATINMQLTDPYHKSAIVFCPGTYTFDVPIQLRGQLLFGLGVPRILSKNGNDLVQGYGNICGIIFQAAIGTDHQTVLVNLNDKRASHLWDVYCRVGGGDVTGVADKTSLDASADTMLLVGGSASVLDNVWCWVADHYSDGSYTKWDGARCRVGVHITGTNVICYGMFSEHNREVNLQWDGDGGEMYMFQSELNYFPPDQATADEMVSYKLGDSVKKHKIRGAGAYCFFPCSGKSTTDVHAQAGFSFPKGATVDYKTVFTVFLNGFGGISNVIMDGGTGDGKVVQWQPDSSGKKTFHCDPDVVREGSKTYFKYRCSPDGF